jgi:DNA-binding Lrp family transcriptional regulator
MKDFELKDGLWLSISGVAKHLGVSRQAVSKRVPALEASGLLTCRRGENGAKEINLAQYMIAIRAVGDPARELAAETRRGSVEADYADRMVNVADLVVADWEYGSKYGARIFGEIEYMLAREVQALRARLGSINLEKML